MNYERYAPLIINYSLNDFCNRFNEIQAKLKYNLQKFNVDINKALPAVFNNKNLKIDAVYSSDKRQLLFVFEGNDKFSNENYMRTGDVIEYLDTTGIWANSNSLIHVENSSVSFEGLTMEGGKPFSTNGSETEMFLSNLKFVLPNGKTKNIEFGIVISYEKFLIAYKDLDQYVAQLFHSFWSFYKETNQKLENGSSSLQITISKLEKIYEQMEYFFFESSVLEKDLENFINNHPVIMEQGLNLYKAHPQLRLNDVLSKHNQDLIPDVIALDPDSGRWVIIDYKLGRGVNLIKKPNSTRASFISKVTDLQSQLRVYRKYFNEKEHRDDFKKQHGFFIDESPNTVGLIGMVDENSRKDFLEIVSEHNRWFMLVPYNDLQSRFKRYIETLKNIG